MLFGIIEILWAYCVHHQGDEWWSWSVCSDATVGRGGPCLGLAPWKEGQETVTCLS
jgi:hypothetical protein